MLKAIETKYKGYRFRSRLEARWAVFFDALGIAWEYEKEGYDLGAAGWYLPDFYFPKTDRWVEIKADIFGNGTLHDDQWPLMYAFSEQAKTIIFPIIGTPGDEFSYSFSHGHITGHYKRLPMKMTPFVLFDQCAIDNAAQSARSARFEHGEQP